MKDNPFQLALALIAFVVVFAGILVAINQNLAMGSTIVAIGLVGVFVWLGISAVNWQIKNR